MKTCKRWLCIGPHFCKHEINSVDANGTTPLDTANYTKVINIKDAKKLSIINEIMTVLSEKDALSASDL